MIGILRWKAAAGGERTVTVREQSILHVRFQQAELLRGPKTPEALVRRRVTAATKKLHKLGVENVVLPENFSYHEQLGKWSVKTVDSLPLRRELAADWVRWDLEKRKISAAGARVAVCAAALTGEVVRTVTELSLRHRYVLLSVPRGGEELCRQLRREYGVSLLLEASPEQIEGADAMLMFDPGKVQIRPGVITLYDTAIQMPPLSLPPALQKALPGGVDREALLAVLRKTGALKPGQISVGGGDLG